MDSVITLVVIGLIIWKILRPFIREAKNASGSNNAPKSPASAKGYGNINTGNGRSVPYRASQVPMRKEASAMQHREASAMPHKHRESGVYDTANRHKWDNSDGAMPHSHANDRPRHIDVATLPKGYILLNGEPVRTKDLENY